MADWRYKLPCGHHDYQLRASEERQGGDAYNRLKQKKLFYCKPCNEHFEYKIDKKTGREIPV